MNDRYLYKAKRENTVEWVEGLLWKKKYNSNKIFISCSPDKDDNEEVFAVDKDTICQCTGLKDKNGKLIWENDKCVVRRPCVLAYGTIKYLDGCFCFVEDKTGNILRLCDVKTNGFEIKIESNIFDNPELLGVK